MKVIIPSQRRKIPKNLAITKKKTSVIINRYELAAFSKSLAKIGVPNHEKIVTPTLKMIIIIFLSFNLLDIHLSDLLSHHWGYVAAIISAILFGVSSTLNKLTLENVNPTVVAGSIYFVAGVLLFAFHLTPLCNKLLAKLDTSETESKITYKNYRTLAFVIICGSIVAPLLLLNGLNQSTAINSSLLLNAEALFTVVIAYVFLNERCAKKEYIGIVMLLVGVIFVTTNGAFQSLTLTENLVGNLLIIGACFFWGIDNNLSKHLSKKRDIVLVTGLKCFIGGSALLALSFLLGFSFSIPLSAVPYILFVGAFSIAFSILFFLFALRKIGSMRTGVIFSTSSLFGALLAFVVLSETFTIIQLIAGFVMVLGIYVLYRCGETKPNPL